jgi:hypothetical protein
MADFRSIWDPTASLVSPSTVKLSNKYSSNFDPNALASSLVAASTPTPKGQTPPISPTFPGGSAVPTGDINKNYQDFYDFYTKMRPGLQADRASEYQMQAELTRKQMSDLYPYMSAAASEATARNLAASEKFLAFKESAPSNIQNIMASKQGQASSAADAEYRRALGIAAQQSAATDFARKYVGQTFQQA